MVVFFVAGIILATVISVSAVREAYRNKNIENEVQKLKKEANRIQSENSDLQKKIDYYSTPEFTERVSKDKMNMQKPDEGVIVVEQSTEQKNSNSEESEKVAVQAENKSNYRKWWDIFFKY